MKKGFGLVELVIVLIVIIVIYFVFLKTSNAKTEIFGDKKEVKTQKQMIDTKIQEIQDIRNSQLKFEQEKLDTED